MKRPLGVSLISYYYIFGAIALVVTSIIYNPSANVIGIADRFGLTSFPERLFRIVLAVFTLILIYGYMGLKRWGFWLMVVYSILFGVISSLLITNQTLQPFLGNLIWSLIVLVYTIYNRKAFLKAIIHHWKSISDLTTNGGVSSTMKERFLIYSQQKRKIV